MEADRSEVKQVKPNGQAGIQPPLPRRSPTPLTVFRHYSWHVARARVHVYYDSWVPSGEVGHFAFHELPARPSEGEYSGPSPVPSFPAAPSPLLPLPRASPSAAGRGRIPTEAEAEALQLLHVAT